jgi:hypothetical protein
MDRIFDVAEISVPSAHVGRRRLETMLTVSARTLPEASARGLRRILVRCPGEPVAVEAMTIAEPDRRLRNSARSSCTGTC